MQSLNISSNQLADFQNRENPDDSAFPKAICETWRGKSFNGCSSCRRLWLKPLGTIWEFFKRCFCDVWGGSMFILLHGEMNCLRVFSYMWADLGEQSGSLLLLNVVVSFPIARALSLQFIITIAYLYSPSSWDWENHTIIPKAKIQDGPPPCVPGRMNCKHDPFTTDVKDYKTVLCQNPFLQRKDIYCSRKFFKR